MYPSNTKLCRFCNSHTSPRNMEGSWVLSYCEWFIYKYSWEHIFDRTSKLCILCGETCQDIGKDFRLTGDEGWYGGCNVLWVLYLWIGWFYVRCFKRGIPLYDILTPSLISRHLATCTLRALSASSRISKKMMSTPCMAWLTVFEYLKRLFRIWRIEDLWLRTTSGMFLAYAHL